MARIAGPPNGKPPGRTMVRETAGRAAKATEGTAAIEVKVTVIDRDEAKALRKFGLKRENGESRRIFFYDTRELDLFKRGVCLRAREMDAEACDSTVKIRPVVPKRIAPEWSGKSGFKVEADAIGAKTVRSASFTAEQKLKEVGEVASGDREVAKLFSGEQEEFLVAMSPVQIDFSKLVALGPVAVMRWKFRHEGLPYDLCAEEWRLPDGRDVLEISIKARRSEAAAAQATRIQCQS